MAVLLPLHFLQAEAEAEVEAEEMVSQEAILLLAEAVGEVEELMGGLKVWEVLVVKFNQ